MTSIATARLVQLQRGNGAPRGRRRRADASTARRDGDSVYSLAQSAIAGIAVARRTDRGADDRRRRSTTTQSTRPIGVATSAADRSSVRASRLLVSGTGLTHLGSAKDRQAMHGVAESELTDSMKMFRWGVDGGRPAPGQVGHRTRVVLQGERVRSCAPTASRSSCLPYGEDGGEEAEIAGVYIIDARRTPVAHRHVQRQRILRPSVREAELSQSGQLEASHVFARPGAGRRPDFESVAGKVAIERDGAIVWSKDIITGEANMCSQPAEHRASSFQVRQPSPARRRPRPLLRRVQPSASARAFSLPTGT